MPRYVMRLQTEVELFDENGQSAGYYSVGGEVAIALGSKGRDEIVDRMVDEFRKDVAHHSKKMLSNANYTQAQLKKESPSE